MPTFLSHDMSLLYATALGVAVVHTVLGPDHYLPFVAMAKAGKWTTRKTMVVTVLCGIGHVLGSVVLGLTGVALGLSLSRLTLVESTRGQVAGWLLLAFGLVLFVWGLRRAFRHRPHTHLHTHADGTIHAHRHQHNGAHLHTHTNAAGNQTLWVLFVIFLFGPCEPLIPILMYPAAQGSIWHVVAVSVLFGAVTITTMSALVLAGVLGLRQMHFHWLERYSHALAGLLILLSGVAVVAGL